MELGVRYFGVWIPLIYTGILTFGTRWHRPTYTVGAISFGDPLRHKFSRPQNPMVYHAFCTSVQNFGRLCGSHIRYYMREGPNVRNPFWYISQWHHNHTETKLKLLGNTQLSNGGSDGIIWLFLTVFGAPLWTRVEEQDARITGARGDIYLHHDTIFCSSYDTKQFVDSCFENPRICKKRYDRLTKIAYCPWNTGVAKTYGVKSRQNLWRILYEREGNDNICFGEGCTDVFLLHQKPHIEIKTKDHIQCGWDVWWHQRHGVCGKCVWR